MAHLRIDPVEDDDTGNGNPPPKDPPKTGGRSAPGDEDGKQ